MKRVPFKIDFLFRASTIIVYRFLTTPDCLIRWFCDKSDIVDGQYVYSWDGEDEIATIIEDVEGEFLKLQWEEAESDDEFLEFKISRSPVTGETLLEITDWCDDDEIEDQQQLWSTQMNSMKKEMGG
jgi:uncharacterized protein YndB with AHSA1/START domain